MESASDLFYFLRQADRRACEEIGDEIGDEIKVMQRFSLTCTKVVLKNSWIGRKSEFVLFMKISFLSIV